ncbi:hotdog fold thioesterase [Aquimarina sp. AD10]|uniref:Thioesterase n=1 Tax=Aquimarina aggregata TaxID=1642818 RepID=A0A163C8K6_9FLAO|nr:MULTISPECIES: hotdog fold thioesterase [Aquimarina]AXT59853.1 hotdog fold thioesterase [Aquimarina sp. AD10]KZS42160.1 thioesterase [Aquimarina aggregata]RKN00230.1 hotdog fold thioesterase [Aquimarina sp. AD10]
MKLTQEEVLEQCAKMCKNTLMETLEISFCEVGKDYLIAKMPVTPRVHQPDGVLHGGAMVALAESVGSAATQMFLNSKEFSIRGIEISANHVKSIRSGYVFARAEVVHQGRTTQLWDIKIRDEEENLISIVKLTTIALPKRK